MRLARSARFALTLMACTVLPPVAADAHHSAAMFDLTKSVVVNGTVHDWQWTNPHAWLWLTVTGPNGASSAYGIELGALSMLRRGGLTKDSFTPGQKVSVTIHPLRNGQPGGMFVSADSDGKTIKPFRPQ